MSIELPIELSGLEAVAMNRLSELKKELKSSPDGKLVRVAIFDHRWERTPSRAPIATLEWADWREAERLVFFPYAKKPATSARDAALVIGGKTLKEGKVPPSVGPAAGDDAAHADTLVAKRSSDVEPELNEDDIETQVDIAAQRSASRTDEEAGSRAPRPSNKPEIKKAPVSLRAAAEKVAAEKAKEEQEAAKKAAEKKAAEKKAAEKKAAEEKAAEEKAAEEKAAEEKAAEEKAAADKKAADEKAAADKAAADKKAAEEKAAAEKKAAEERVAAEKAAAEQAAADKKAAEEKAAAEKTAAEEKAAAEKAAAEKAAEEKAAEEKAAEEKAAAEQKAARKKKKAEDNKAEAVDDDPTRDEDEVPTQVHAKVGRSRRSLKERKSIKRRALPDDKRKSKPRASDPKPSQRKVKLGRGSNLAPPPVEDEALLTRDERDRRMEAARIQLSSLPPRPSMRAPRVEGEELLLDMFEAMSGLNYLGNALDGAEFVLRTAMEKLPCETDPRFVVRHRQA